MANEKINYLEYPAKDLQSVKSFFEQVFNWQFTDYGPEYTSFANSAGINGGFYLSELASSTENGACLTVLHSDDLLATQTRVQLHGGQIVKACFEFPGGRRFHFTDPSGNEFAVWSEK